MANKDTLLDALLKKQQELKDGLVETPAQTLEEYNRRVGRHMGIGEAIEVLLDIVRAGERDN